MATNVLIHGAGDGCWYWHLVGAALKGRIEAERRIPSVGSCQGRRRGVRRLRTKGCPMRRFSSIFVAVVFALSVLGPAAAAAPGSEVWVSRYDGPAGQRDAPAAMAVGPAGGRLFISGSATGQRNGRNFTVLTLETSRGLDRWAIGYDGTADRGDEARDVALSFDGATAYATGFRTQNSAGRDFFTVALDASSGTKQWTASYDGPASGADAAAAIAVSVDGSAVFVTGPSEGSRTNQDYATVAYDPATGAELWSVRYDGPASREDEPVAIALSPGSDSVYVTGVSEAWNDVPDIATVAYDAATGAELWVKRYDNPTNWREDWPNSVVVNEAMSTVYVVGMSGGDMVVLAYSPAGGRMWIRRYDGPGPRNGFDEATAAVVGPDLGPLFVTGRSEGRDSGVDYATLAFDATTGELLWTSRYDGRAQAGDYAMDVEASIDGSSVYVTGGSAGRLHFEDEFFTDYATVAYDAGTGHRQWAKRYDGPAGRFDFAIDVAVDPNGTAVYVVGWSAGSGTGIDIATIRYRA